uniref:Uncharacterized protein n=1 Tax=uncultured marine virus TaxID=186617 RepID=A0A0F7L8R2_9VIRU|nr:hypothetical protein [uncultured marine virus]
MVFGLCSLSDVQWRDCSPTCKLFVGWGIVVRALLCYLQRTCQLACLWSGFISQSTHI